MENRPLPRHLGKEGGSFVCLSLIHISPTASPEKTPEPTAIPTAAPTAAGPQYALVTTASGSLNLRAQPSAIGALVTQIPRFGMVEVRCV